MGKEAVRVKMSADHSERRCHYRFEPTIRPAAFDTASTCPHGAHSRTDHNDECDAIHWGARGAESGA